MENKVVVYCRVSTELQDTDMQKRDLSIHLKDEPFEIYEDYFTSFHMSPFVYKYYSKMNTKSKMFFIFFKKLGCEVNLNSLPVLGVPLP